MGDSSMDACSEQQIFHTFEKSLKCFLTSHYRNYQSSATGQNGTFILWLYNNWYKHWSNPVVAYIISTVMTDDNSW